MCKAWEDMIRKTEEETKERVTLQNLRSVMKNLHLSVDQAMDALRIPESRRAHLSAKL